MKRLTMIGAAGMFLLLTVGCKRSSDVLATYEGGRITRGEFYQWLDARRISKDLILKRKDQQKSNIERFALERITAREARKAGFDKSDEFTFLKNLAVRNFYAQSLTKNLTESGAFKEKAAKARIIKLSVNTYRINRNRREKLSDAELENAFKEKADKARELIRKLDEGASFDELAKQYSDDFTKRKGGDIGYVVSGMRGEEFSKAVLSVKEGEYTKEPVRIGNAIYIIMVEKIVTLTQDNLDDIIEDKGQREGLKRRLQYGTARRLQEDLLKAKDVEDKTATANLALPNDLLYRVGTVECTVADLNRIFDYIAGKRKQMGRPSMNADERMKREMAKRMLREEVMMREAKRRGLDKEERFKNELAMFLDYNLAGLYEASVITAGVNVKPADVYDYYLANKDRMYTRHERIGGKDVKAAIPFHEVKDMIQHRLFEMKRAEKRNAWNSEILKKYKFKIDESELEGK